MAAMDRNGERRTMKCGLEATIISYRSAKDLDVQFETGEIREHCRYQNFQKGQILPVSLNEVPVTHKGEISRMKCGLKAEIIAYRRSEDMDVRFLDGSVRRHCAYSHFSKGEIIPPRPAWGNFQTVAFAGFEIEMQLESETGENLFIARCHGCDLHEVFTEKSMMEHEAVCRKAAADGEEDGPAKKTADMT